MPTVTLLCEGWQVGGGMHGEPGIGDELTSAVEFVPLSAGRPASTAQVSRSQSRESEYQVTARVLQRGNSQSSTVLDLGGLNVQRRERGTPDEAIVEGALVELTLSIGLDPWLDAPWIEEVHRHFGAYYRWRIEGIVAVDPQSDLRHPIRRATDDAVPDGGYCLLDCVMVGSTDL